MNTPTPTILIVEDDPPLRDLIYLVTKRVLGYSALTASNGLEALEHFHAAHPQVMVLDILLPQMNGLDVLKQLNAGGDLQNTTVIVISGLGYLEIVQQAISAGARDFIVKPFDVEVLVDRIQQAMEEAGAVVLPAVGNKPLLSAEMTPA